ncbi:hypothetical protein C2L64_52185 [Paraburkholderia hospita]|uniref:Uncharacterized protein n=1 Tax=Paraburkholderia hospita TaxID=169430 RepID=A0AAN1JNB3_9BURK|nr:hypothetical protein C2L64_52185 [Paraburkholderia hospita]
MSIAASFSQYKAIGFDSRELASVAREWRATSGAPSLPWLLGLEDRLDTHLDRQAVVACKAGDEIKRVGQARRSSPGRNVLL